LWEEGRRPGGQVAALTLVASLAVAWGNLALTSRLTLFFDLTFVVLCLMAALAVRPRDFFVVGVLPPVALLITIAVLATLARPSVADEGDSLVQAVVSGLAHHAGALVAGYALALGILALRQVALRNAGRLRNAA
jgi:hypothetical protein